MTALAEKSPPRSAPDAPELHAKAELLDLLLSATQDGVVDWNLLSGEASYNSRWKYLLGFDSEELPEFHETPSLWRELIHPDEREATTAMLDDHLEHGWPFTATVRMRHRYGGYRHILCRGTAHRDEQDRPLRMVIIFSDIDERIRVEERQRALVSALPDTLFGVHADGTIHGLKRGALREGSPFAKLREGLSLADCLDDARALASLQAALTAPEEEPHSGATGGQTFRITTALESGARLHYEVRIVRCGEDESVCIARDVTEQRELEDRLLQSQKLGAIGQLAAGVAHEINTPMQFIGDNLHFASAAVTDLLSLTVRMKELLACAKQRPLEESELSELSEAEQAADFDFTRQELPEVIGRSLVGVERVTKIVRAMKSFAHPGGEHFAPTDLKTLIESTAMVATNEWKYVAEMQLELDAPVPPVPCVGGELNQVVLNLIVNAAHAIADVVGSSGEKGNIRISLGCDDTHAEIRVADTGSGIPEHARAKVFDPFFTTKEVGKGTGQGLSIAYNCIVKRHKGTIVFETELGAGTTFIIRLPLVHEAPARSGAPS